MKLLERLNVLIQAITLSQKSGKLTLDEAVNAKSAIDVISSGSLNQNYVSAINALIEIIVTSQKKGAYSLKDAYMIYIAIDGIETEFKNEIDKLNDMSTRKETDKSYNINQSNKENNITIPPKKMKKS